MENEMENEYPKWLYLADGSGILVQDADEDTVAREGGFGDLVGGTPPGGKPEAPRKPAKGA